MDIDQCFPGFHISGVCSDIRSFNRIMWKQYKCSHCDKRFSRSEHLKKHEKIHTGEKLYTCDQCGNSFAYLANLKVHKNILVWHSTEVVA